MNRSQAERDEAIAALVPKVHRLAARVRMQVHNAIDVEDLIGAGYEAIVRAVDTFKPNTGAPLEAFAMMLARCAMLNAIRSWDPAKAERARALLRETDAFAADFAVANGRLPTTAEIEAAHPGYLKARTRVEIYAGLLPDSLDVRDDAADRAFDVATARHTTPALLNELSPRERQVIEAHYFKEQPLNVIARDLGVASQRASQIHVGALQKMRRKVTIA